MTLAQYSVILKRLSVRGSHSVAHKKPTRRTWPLKGGVKNQLVTNFYNYFLQYKRMNNHSYLEDGKARENGRRKVVCTFAVKTTDTCKMGR